MVETDGSDKPQAASDEPSDETHHSTQEELLAVVADKEARKLQARRAQDKSVWFGLGMFGMIGWSVAAPTLLALALGIWLDRRWPTRFSWTLTLLFIGIALGCLNAWFWVKRERRPIEHRPRPPESLEQERPDATDGEQDDA